MSAALSPGGAGGAGAKPAVVLIPTTGAPALRRAVESVLAQTLPTACYVVCDGELFVRELKSKGMCPTMKAK